MTLTLDIGNTRAKFTLFAGGEVQAFHTVAHAEAASLLHRLWRDPAIEALCWCSVGPDLPEVERVLSGGEGGGRRVLRLCPTDPPPGIRVDYRTPATLGADRLAAVLGARTLRPEQNLLVVDAGTCITFDLLLADGRYIGGNISPGVALRIDAMHRCTARLPQISAEGATPLLGDTTETALRSGVLRGIAYEIEGYIHHLRAIYGDVCVFLTGGNRFDFLISTESCTFADDYLVARGLATLAEAPPSGWS